VLPVNYASIKLDAGYRIDLMVDSVVIVEAKAVEALTSLHEAQMLTYLKLSGRRLGLLINFNVVLLKNGIKRRSCDSENARSAKISFVTFASSLCLRVFLVGFQEQR
jgi:hypothetical protein